VILGYPRSDMVLALKGQRSKLGSVVLLVYPGIFERGAYRSIISKLVQISIPSLAAALVHPFHSQNISNVLDRGVRTHLTDLVYVYATS